MDESIERTWIPNALEADLLFVEAAVYEWFLLPEINGARAILGHNGIQLGQAIGRVNQKLGRRYATRNYQFFVGQIEIGVFRFLSAPEHARGKNTADQGH